MQLGARVGLLTLALGFALAAGKPAAHTTWWTQADGLHRLDPSNPAAPERLAGPAAAVMIDPLARWSAADHSLLRTELISGVESGAAIAPSAHDRTLLASDGEGGAWLARGMALVHYDTTLRAAGTVAVAGAIDALAAAGPGALWVATGTEVTRFDARGIASEHRALDLPRDARVRSLHVDPAAGLLWVVADGRALRLDIFDALRERSRVELPPEAVAALDPASGELWALSAQGLRVVDRQGTRLLELAAPTGFAEQATAVLPAAADGRVLGSDAHGLFQVNLADGTWTRVVEHGPARLVEEASRIAPSLDVTLDEPWLRVRVSPLCVTRTCPDDPRYGAHAQVRIALDDHDATPLLRPDGSSGYALSLGEAAARSARVVRLDVIDAYGNTGTTRRIDLPALRSGVAQKANLPPTVSITAPGNNTVAVAPAAFTITAAASDADGTIAKVEFYRNGVLLGTDATAPYAWTWSNVAVGIYSLTAKAYDNAGASTLSTAVSVQVKANVAPTVTLASPPNNSNFVAPATITLSATAADADGSVAKVDFLRGGATLIGSVTKAPFTYTWSNVAAGTYSLTARATDDKGAATTSTVVTARVNNPPNVALTAPAANAVFIPPVTVTLQASASDTDGTVSKVEFFQNGTLLGADTSSPYSFAWANPPLGNYSLTAKATDNLGATRVSAPVAISVKANQPPAVTLTAPPANLQRVAGTSLALAATASDPDGTITKVDFRLGGVLVGTDTSAPYTATLTVPLGTFPITAVATDNKGGQTSSAPVMLTGVANQLPVVSLDAPLDGQVFPAAAPPDISLKASASDPDGAIARVRFMLVTHFADGTQSTPTVIATLAQPPYVALWRAVPFTVNPLYANATDPESYELWAEADDDAGGTGFAPQDPRIKVPNASPWSIAIDQPRTGAEYAAPATVVIVGVPLALGGAAGDAIARVELVVDGASMATLAAANGSRSEYVYTWPNAPLGSHAIQLRLTDAAGFTVQSDAATLSVRAADQLPVISLTSPANGLDLPGLPAPTIALAASASDPDGTIAGVDFIGDGEVIARTAAPFTASWTSLATGVHAIRARARDERGRQAESRPVFVNVRVADRSPVVTLTSPAPGGTYHALSPVVLAADAVAPDSLISSVDFVYVPSNVAIGSATTAPYRITWTPPAGSATYAIRAVVRTQSQGIALSTPVTVNVSSNSAPAVTLTGPRDGQVFAGGLPIALSATAADPDGTIARVDFVANGTIVATLAAPPYNASWLPTVAGAYAITAKATDNAGAVAVSSVANINVLAAVPSVTVTAPAPNSAALAGQPLAITAQAVMPGRTLARLDFLADAAVLGSVAVQGGVSATIATFSWAAPPAGTHVLTVRAVATDGTTLTSASVNIGVSDFAVSLGEPYAGQTYLAPADIRILAVPTSGGSTVSRVDFLGDGVVLGSATAPPYVLVWRGMGVGTHTVSVRAVDSAGLVVSASTSVNVVTAPTLSVDAGIDGSNIPDDSAGISGTLQAPQNAALIINGQLAALDPQGRFFIENLLLQPGINRLVLSLNTLDAPPVQQTITLNSTGTAPFAIDLSPQQGFAPLSATLSIRNRSGTTYQRVEIDYNDDGTPDQTIASAAGGETRLAYTLPAPGLYRMRVTVYDASNRIVYQARRQARVYDRAELAGTVVGNYWTMLDRLAANDPAAALRMFTADAQDRYADVFATLGNGVAAIAPQLRRLVDGVVGEDIAELTHARDTPGGPALFMIYLVRGRDGLWRIETM